MDQRVDNERRSESAPGRELKPVVDKSRKNRSWGATLREHRLLTLAIVVGILIAVIALVLWWLNARQYETTDDAFIDARTVQISAQVAAAIVDVPVTDNELVEPGTVLVHLDDRDFKSALDEAKAQVQQAEAGITNLKAQLAAQDARIDQAKKQVEEAQAALTFAQQQANRYQLLAKQGSGTVEQAEQYQSNLLQKQAVLDAAEANAIAAEKQKPVLAAQQELSEAELLQRNPAVQQAETNLSRTLITAPVAGRVVHLTAAKGAYAAVGQALMMFVPRDVWVTANFKETELDLVRPGQPVTIQVDAYPERTFEGHIDSVQAGSGTAFSLLPAENATGNYVKIVQRVPVKIVFNQPPGVLLGPGMSVVPTVKVR
jgi:membrane fusion protein (multidrug efflux system)